MNAAVGRIADPGLALVGRQAKSVTGAAMAFGRTLLEALNFDLADHLAACGVADFKAQQAVDIDVAARSGSVNGERSDEVAERADLADGLLRLRIHDRQRRRAQAGKKRARAIQAANSIVRPALRVDFRQDFAD